MQFLYQPGPGSAGATFPPASIHGYSLTVGLFTSPPSRAGWPSVSEVGVGGEGAQTWSLMGGLESPPIRPRRERRVFLPLKRGRKKTQRLALTLFVNGSHSSNRRWDRLRRASPPNQPWIEAEGRRDFYVLLGEEGEHRMSGAPQDEGTNGS